MSKSQVLDLNDENFDEEVYGSGQPVLVEFYSEGTYSCRELSGIVDALSQEYAGKVRIGRIDMEANWQTSRALGVTTAPTVLLLQNDRVVERVASPKTREDYRQSINELIAQYWVI